MDEDNLHSDWKRLAKLAKQSWPRLTDEDLTFAEDDGEYLAMKLSQYYGLAEYNARKVLREIGYRFDHPDPTDRDWRVADEDVTTARPTQRR